MGKKRAWQKKKEYKEKKDKESIASIVWTIILIALFLFMIIYFGFPSDASSYYPGRSR